MDAGAGLIWIEYYSLTPFSIVYSISLFLFLLDSLLLQLSFHNIDANGYFSSYSSSAKNPRSNIVGLNLRPQARRSLELD